MDDKLSDKEVATLAESCPWSVQETTDFIRNAEKVGLSPKVIVKMLDGCAENGLPLPSPYVISETLRLSKGTDGK